VRIFRTANFSLKLIIEVIRQFYFMKLSVFNYSIQNQLDASTLDIYIDGDIVDAETQTMYKQWFNNDTTVSYKSFRDQVLQSEAKIFNVYINSGGGLVTDAMAIHDLLIDLQDKGKVVNTEGRGIIASAATFILLAGRSAKMSSNSWLMIHNVSGMTYGNVSEIESYANTMRKFNDSAVSFYENLTGLSSKDIGKMMDQETWMTAKEAKEKGFIKHVSGEAQFKKIINSDQWQFQNKAVLNSYNSFTETINNAFAPLIEKLGLSDKNDDKIKNAFSEFGTAVTNAVKESAPTEEAFTTKVNNAVTEALKNIAENESFKNALNENKEGQLTKETVNSLITEKLTNVVTKDDLNTANENILNAVGARTGKKTTEEVINTSKKAKGKFAGADWNQA
jgi:ATP-dependent Clp protease protease subunit